VTDQFQPVLTPERLPEQVSHGLPCGSVVLVDAVPDRDAMTPACDPAGDRRDEHAAWQAFLDGRAQLVLPPGALRRCLVDLGVYRACWPRVTAGGAGGRVRLRFVEGLFAVADLGGFTELAAESVLIEPFATKAVSYPGDWQLGPILEATGLQPRHVLRVVERLCQDYGEAAPEALGEQLALASKVLKGEWLVPPALSPSGTPETHVLIGPAGSGKTTALCKWLAQLVLVEGRSTAVFRLDGETANTGEFLSVHSEVLGVPVQRSLTPDWRSAAEMVFIDLPGISHTDRSSMNKLLEQLKEMRPAQVHLVLNAAYESALLMAQIRGFAPLQPDDWMATHLDEEPRWGKLWNGIMGTNCPLSWMGIGQNIPGMFHRADPVRVLNRQFNR
jgi:hypothetical protein